MDIAALQDVIERTYGDRDRARGTAATVAWLCEEVGELAQAVRKGTPEQQAHEFADVVAWVVTLANQMGIDLDTAVQRYATGCPRCGDLPMHLPLTTGLRRRTNRTCRLCGDTNPVRPTIPRSGRR